MFDSEVLDSEIAIRNYNVFRSDRLGGHGGGSCIYVNNTISAEIDKKFKLNDCLSIRVTLDSIMITLICVYRSPSMTHDNNLSMIDYLDKYTVSQSSENILIITGDFNLPDVDWDNGVVNCPMNTTNKLFLNQQNYLEFFRCNGLHWMLDNSMITRCRFVKDKLQTSNLDQILTSDPNVFKYTCLTSPLNKSDHLGILGVLNIKTNTEMLTLNKLKWGKVKTSELSNYGKNIDWKFDNENQNTEMLFKNLSLKFQIITNMVPMATCKVTKNGNIISREPFSTASLRKSRTKLNKLWYTYNKYPSLSNYNIAREASQVFEAKSKQCVLQYEKKITSQLKSNPKIFYSYLASKRKVKNTISGLKTTDGKLLTSPEDIANELGAFFYSTFTSEPNGPVPELQNVTSNKLKDLHITEDQVKTVLCQLNESKSPGSDTIHPKLLKSLSDNNEFIEAVTKLFKTCYETGRMPEIWKLADVVALHKKGDKLSSSNYRPISLTSVLCKCYEKILKTHILEHFEKYLCKEQHGFVGNKSCFSNLLECMHRAYDILEQSDSLDILYLDFMKAFDSVPHKRLLSKLKSYGIDGKTLRVIEDFLSNRKFRVRIGEKYSKLFNVLSGVPQGSVLGPLLFIIYLNDLPGGIQSFVSLFADDLKLLINSDAYITVQEDLDYLTEWQNKWLLKFNTVDSKCKILHVGKSNPNHSYYLNDHELPNTTTEKDLGVNINDTLTWTSHIEIAINKAMSMTGWVTRNVSSRDRIVMLNIYKSLIRPQVEYCVQLWNPRPRHGNWSTILKIEEVQRKFTRLIDGIGLKTYRERLETLSLTTLVERRARGDLIECFKIYKGFANYGKDLLKISRSGYNFIMTAKKGSKMADFFPERAINHWNKLPDHVKEAESVDILKNRLERYKRRNLRAANGNFWDLSNELFQKIESGDRQQYTDFMMSNPRIAAIKHVNIR